MLRRGCSVDFSTLMDQSSFVRSLFQVLASLFAFPPLATIFFSEHELMSTFCCRALGQGCTYVELYSIFLSLFFVFYWCWGVVIPPTQDVLNS